MKRKAHKLSVEPDYRFLLIGISSHENDYHLCWAINQHMNLELQKTDNLVVYNTKLKENQSFAMFHSEDEETLLTYYLLSNRCDNGFLVKEYKNIDFLMQIHGEVIKTFKEEFNKKLNEISVIITSFYIQPETLRSRDRLLIR